jgi:hypothetical protein
MTKPSEHLGFVACDLFVIWHLCFGALKNLSLRQKKL